MSQFGVDGRTKIPIQIADASGSLVILQPGVHSSSLNSTYSMSLAIAASASLSIEVDPDDGKSVQFRIPKAAAGTSNDRIAFYASSSGRIGVGTKDPESSFDVRDFGEDADPKDRAAKAKMLRLAKTQQTFDVPVTASMVSSSGTVSCESFFIGRHQLQLGKRLSFSVSGTTLQISDGTTTWQIRG